MQTCICICIYMHMQTCDAYASYADTAATGMGLVADQAATRKTAKYVDFTAAYIFQPIAVENLGPINASALDFISNLGQ